MERGWGLSDEMGGDWDRKVSTYSSPPQSDASQNSIHLPSVGR